MRCHLIFVGSYTSYLVPTLMKPVKGRLFYFAGEDDDYMEVRDQPSSHRLASSMGVDAHNMQFMKASFFGDEDMPAPSFGRNGLKYQ